MAVENLKGIIIDYNGCHWAYSPERRKIYCLEADIENIEIIADKMHMEEEITEDDLSTLTSNGYYCDDWAHGFALLGEYGYLDDGSFKDWLDAQKKEVSKVKKTPHQEMLDDIQRVAEGNRLRAEDKDK